MRSYAGIGSRATPPEVLKMMTKIAILAETNGYVLRSGGADGADKAFEAGVVEPDMKVILRPKDATLDSIIMAETFHPAWGACNSWAKALHGRNAMIVLGDDLKTPVEMVLYWTHDENRGGTSMGLRIAEANDIPCYSVEGALTAMEFFERNERKWPQ